MYAARRHLLRTLAAARKYSSYHGTDKGPVYELRRYSIKPGKFSQFMDVMENQFHIRLRYSQPLGYWNTEIGGLFNVVHLWEYESLGERARIRQSLAKDQQWQSDFLPAFLSSTQALQNDILILSPGTSLLTDFQPSDSAVYALRTLPKPTTFAPLSDDEKVVGKFIGLFHDIFHGKNDLQQCLDRVNDLLIVAEVYSNYHEYLLLRYSDPDSAYVHFKKRNETGGVDYGTTQLMTPFPWSPLK